MPEITKEGRYSVRIVDALFREMEKKNDGSFVVVLKLETADGYYAWYDMLYTHTVISSGRNAGLMVAQASENLLIELGVEKGYLGDLLKKVQTKSIEAEATMKWDESERDGKVTRRLKCAWLNPPRTTQSLAEVDIDAMLAKFKAGGAAPAEPVAVEPAPEATAEDANDNVPF